MATVPSLLLCHREVYPEGDGVCRFRACVKQPRFWSRSRKTGKLDDGKRRKHEKGRFASSNAGFIFVVYMVLSRAEA